jgi:photosystem II stability/assembly factor-like uncharacterized protein
MSGSSEGYPFTIVADRTVLLFVDKDFMMSDGSSGEILLDINDGTDYALMLNKFTPRPADQRQSTSDSAFKDGTTYNPIGKLEDVILPFSIKVIGDEIVSAKDKLDVLLNESRKDTVYVVYAPDSFAPITFYSAHPVVSFDTDSFWYREFQNTNMAIVNFELIASCGFGTVEELTPLENLAPNPSFENWTGATIDDWTITVGGASAITKEVGTVFDGAASVKMVRNGGACYITTTGYITIDPDDPWCYDGYVYSTAALDCSFHVRCYDSANNFLADVSFGAYTRGATAWTREIMYRYHAGGIPNYYIAPSDWPAGTAKIRLIVYLAEDGTVYLDKVIFANVKYISDYAMDGVLGLRIFPEDIKGDLPALCDFYISNPFTSPAWKAQDSGVNDDLHGVDALDASHVWGVGEIGTIVFCDGVTWAEQVSGTTNYLSGISAFDSTHIWAVGQGRILFSDDSSTWAVQDATADQMHYGVHAIAADNILAVGHSEPWVWPNIEYRKIYKSSDGTTWVLVYTGPAGTLNAVHASDATHIIAVGDTGTILTSTDGTTWTQRLWGNVPYMVTHDLFGVYVLDATHAWVVGEDGVILFSANAGVTWTQQTSGTTKTLRSVYAYDENNVWVSGDDGTLLFYNGTVWTLQNSGTSKGLNGISGLDDENVWAVGEEGIILKGIYSAGALAITDLIIGQRCGYHEDCQPVVECSEGDIQYDPYRRWGTYRELDATETNEFLFNLASHALLYPGSYAIGAGLTFSGATAFDKGTIHKFLETLDGTPITSQYQEDEIDLGDPDGNWKEVLLQDEMWDDTPVPNYLTSDDAVLGNMNQVVELIAHASLSAVKLLSDYLLIMPTECFVNIGTIESNYLIIDSTVGAVFDSLDGSPSTAMVHSPTECPYTPRFTMDPQGTNFTLVAINDVYDDQRVGMVNLTIRYRSRWKLYASEKPEDET